MDEKTFYKILFWLFPIGLVVLIAVLAPNFFGQVFAFFKDTLWMLIAVIFLFTVFPVLMIWITASDFVKKRFKK